MTKKSIKNFLGTYLFLCLIIIGSTIILNDVEVINNDIAVVITFIVNGIIIGIQLCKTNKLGYSLRDIIFIFMFIFMFISPLIQYLHNDFPWYNTDLLTDQMIVFANITITIFIFIYSVVYEVSNVKTIKRNKFKIKKINNIEHIMDIFYILSIICSIYIIVKTGFGNLFSRYTNNFQIDSSSLLLIIRNTFRSVTVIYISMNLIYIQKNKKIYKIIPFIVGFILMIVINFPTGSARFWIGSIYLGLSVIILNKVRSQNLFKLLVFIGILIIFPIFNNFRNNTFEDVLIKGINMPRISEFFLGGDFDAYSMLVRSIVYVNYHGITLGHQLLGAILFFIPRTIWPTKPIGTGAMIGSEFGWSFVNVSCPYIGEGYVNFGIFGVILFAIILATITKVADYNYQSIKLDKVKDISIIEIIYPFSLGFLFFILRGDLLSTLSNYLGFIFPIVIVKIIRSRQI